MSGNKPATLHNASMTRHIPKNLAPTALLTGFDAFGGHTDNPSWLAVQALHGESVAGHKLVAAQLPTGFVGATSTLLQLLEQHQPALVVCVGQAGGRSTLSLERIAINIQDARIADNTGAQPIDVPVVPGGPAAYFSTLPIKAMMRALTDAGLAADVSQTAGTFVCNHVFYGLMHALDKQRGKHKAIGGFIHVPNLPNQGVPNMPLQDVVRSLRIAVACALTTPNDILLDAGTLD